MNDHDDQVDQSIPPPSGRMSPLLALLVFAGTWLLASVWTTTLSEAFYAAIPPSYAIIALIRCRRAGQTCRKPLVIVGVVTLAVVAVFMLDRYQPSAMLQRYERTVIVFMLVAVLVVASVIWRLLFGAVRRAMRIQPNSSTGKRLVARLVSIALFALVINAHLLAVMETHWPKRRTDATPARLRLAFEPITFTSRDGLALSGWFIPAAASDRTAIVCHGVGADKSDMLEFAYALHEAGYNVLAFDFRGHGASAGHTVTYGARESLDILAAIDFVHSKHPDASRRIVGVGWSMGAASLILAAARDERIEALHIDAAYARTFDIARVIADPFPPVFAEVGLYLGTAIGCLESGTNLFVLAPIEVIGSIAPRPIMLVHGDIDTMIPIAQGEALFAAAGEPKSWHVVTGAGHCQTLTLESPRYEERMVTFLNDALKVAPDG